MQDKDHWENVYASKKTSEVSWFQLHAELSLRLIHQAQIAKTAAIIDVGAGASTLVDDLLAEGFSNITVLDISEGALVEVKQRLGEQAKLVTWRVQNILECEFEQGAYDVWHDRAVFHFLTDTQDRQRYVQQVLQAVRPGGLVIVATFAEDGPDMCSGLPVQRYSAAELHDQFGQPFLLLNHTKETHQTPAGKIQQFVYCMCRKQ